MKKLVLIFFILFTTQIFAQNNNFKTYSIEKGLSQSTIYSIAQDNDGYIWLGTDGGGINVFDGKKFNFYSKRNGLAGSIGRSLLKKSDGDICIGTDNGISFFDGSKFQTIDTTKGFPKGTVLRIIEDKQKNIWAATDNGLVKITKNKNTYKISRIIGTKDGLETNFIFDIYEDKNSKLWLAMYGGVNVISFLENDQISVAKYNVENLLPSSVITCVEADAEGKLWFGTYDVGIFCLDPNTFPKSKITQYNSDNVLKDNTIWDIFQDANKNLWFATNAAGIYKYENKKFHNYSENEGFPSNQVVSIFQDDEKNLWFGTMGLGLIKHMGEHFSHYLLKKSFFNEQITDIAQDDKNLWFSTSGEGVFAVQNFDENPKIKHITTENGLADNSVKNIFIDKNKIFFSTQSGLSVYSNSGIVNITEKDGLPDNRINCTYVDTKGIIWIGTGAGLSIYTNKKYLNVTKESQYALPNDEIQSIIEDKFGNVWIATLSGLLKFHNGLMTTFDEKEGLKDKAIHALEIDKKGDIWMGTFGGGLYKLSVFSLDSVSIKQVSKENLLSSPNIYSLAFENENTLIVGTDKGFDKLTIDKTGKIISVINYDQTNGFTGIENKQNAIFKDAQGNIWFGTVQGLTRYSPKLENIITTAPKLQLTSVELFFEKVNWKDYTRKVSARYGIPENLVLSYDKNHISIKFNAFSLSNPEKIRYKYYLEGLEKTWSPEKTEPEAVYSSLPDGEYVFKVMAKGQNGIWSEPVEFKFTINPPFWKTLWFISLVVIFVLSLAIFYVKFRERKLKQEKAILENKVEERTKEIAEKNKSLEKANDEIIEQRDEIIEQKKELTDSIHYAQRIQRAVLPDNEFFQQHLPNHFVLFRPHSVVSGDFYWATKVGSKIMFTAADCTGHGVPGAFMSMLGMSFLNEIVSKAQINSAGEVLDTLRKNIITALRQRGVSGEQKDGMDMTLCIFDTDTKILQFAGANNPLYIVRSQNVKFDDEKLQEQLALETEDFKLFEIKPDKMPIAIYEKLDNFTTHHYQMYDGDALYLFSDGYADQFGGVKGKKFMYKPFKNLLLNNAHKSMAEQKIIIENAIVEWMSFTDEITGKHFEQIDDVTVLGVKI